MKNILYFVLIVCLPAIAFFEYQNYRRHHPPSVYGYETAKDIDMNFYDAEVTKSYYRNAVEIEGFGRYSWKEFGVDVLTDQPQSPEKRDLVNTYQQMKVSLMQAEEKLRKSQKLKDNGFTNPEIQQMMEKGWSEDQYNLVQFLGEKSYLGLDDTGNNVLFFQELLSAQGYDLEIDGYFRKETVAAVRDFQRKNNLFPSGKVDNLTGKKLLETQNL